MGKEYLVNVEELPFFSIIIPTFNSHKTIGECIRSLYSIDYPKGKYEVVVSDDGSDSVEYNYLIQLQKKYLFKMTHGNNEGPPTARNRGIKMIDSITEFVMFIDSDTKVDPNILLEHYSPRLSLGNKILVTGEIQYFGKQNFLSKSIEALKIFPQRAGNSDNIIWAVTNNISFPREWVERNKLDIAFKTNAEDVDYCFRARKAGYKIIFNPAAIAYHVRHNNWIATLNRAFKYGWGTGILIKKYPSKTIISPSFILKIFFYTFYLFLVSFALYFHEYRLILIPIIHMALLFIFGFCKNYSRKPVYNGGIFLCIYSTIVEAIIANIYSLGVIYKNLILGNNPFLDTDPAEMSPNTTKGIYLTIIFFHLISFIIAYKIAM